MTIILSRDDLIPYLESLDIATELAKWIPKNFQESTILDILSDFAGIQLSSLQLKELLADLLLAGKLEWAAISGDSLPDGTTRPAAPTGIGINAENVWANAPSETYIFRFYVNGIHKLTLNNYYITSLASIGAVSGDVVAIAQVAPADVLEGETVITPAGTVGWWAIKTVT
jgi:hypothetical protein